MTRGLYPKIIMLMLVCFYIAHIHVLHLMEILDLELSLNTFFSFFSFFGGERLVGSYFLDQG